MRNPSYQPEPKDAKPSLHKSISLWEATVYGVGIILGAGIYALIGEAAGIAGNVLWLSFILAAVVASFTALSYCELSSMFPKSAAEYVYVKNAFNSKFLGFLIGWIILITPLFSIATVSLAFAGYFVGLFNAPIVPIAMALIVILSVINFIGIKESARLNVIFTLVEAGGLVLIILIGLPFFGSVDYFASVEQTADFLQSMGPVAAAAALIFFAYIGFEDIANISEETVRAKTAVPKAILTSLAISTVLYVLVAASVVSVVPWQQLGESTEPMALVAGTVFGPNASLILSVIALFATTNTVLILLIVASRILYGLALDKSLPSFIARVHSKTRTPFIAIALTAITSMLFVLIGDIGEVAFVSVFGILLVFFAVNLSVILLRFSKPKAERVFRVPGNIGKFPVLPFFGVISVFFMAFHIKPSAVMLAYPIFALGIPIYLIAHYLAKKSDK